jgi:F420-non-reducing hydrogenase iron-sulfur subunit
MKTIGLEEERLRIEYCSAAEGTKFANMVKEMTEKISKLGPNPLRIVPSVVE